MFERFTDRARRVVVLAQEEARMLSHNYIGTEHILLGLIHEGEGVAAKALESLGISLEACPGPGRGDHRPGPAGPQRPHPVHPARQEGARAVPARGAAARPQLHRHRAHPARPDPRGRGRRRPGAGQKLGADLNRVRQQVIQLLSGYQGKEAADGRTAPPRRRPSSLAGARPVRPQLHAGRARGQARPGHRPREGDRAGHAGPVPPYQEQPGPHRRARRRQDRRASRAWPRRSSRRRARDAQGQADLHPRPRCARRRLALPR